MVGCLGRRACILPLTFSGPAQSFFIFCIWKCSCRICFPAKASVLVFKGPWNCKQFWIKSIIYLLNIHFCCCIFGPHLMCVAYSWLCTQGFFLEGLERIIWGVRDWTWVNCVQGKHPAWYKPHYWPHYWPHSGPSIFEFISYLCHLRDLSYLQEF